MGRERALKVVLVLLGLLFSAGVYPLIGSLLHPADSDAGDTMMLSLYVALGIFLLIAVRNPSAHRSLIAFAAWSSFAHAVAMSILGLEIASQRVGFLVGSAVLVVIGAALIRAGSGEIGCAGIGGRCVAPSQSWETLTPVFSSSSKRRMPCCDGAEQKQPVVLETSSRPNRQICN
jgi:hypothetical protein